jgi:hypothetical protein
MPDQNAPDSNANEYGSGGSDGRESPRRRTIKPELLVGVGTPLAGVAAVLALFVHNVQQGEALATTSVPNPPTTVAQPSEAAASASDTTDSSASTQPGGPADTGSPTQYLADLEPLSSGMPDTAPHDIRGTTFLHSISAQTGGCARNQEAKFVYNLGTHFRTFDAVVGLSDQSTDAGRVQVQAIADGGSLFSAIVGVGHPKTVHVAVTNKLHMTVRQTYLGPNPNLCSEAGDVVWGDARLTR